jgi:peptidoglycan/LPS O-acetylase OafA/YrhL
MGFLSVIITAKVQILNMQLIRMAWLGTFSYSLYLLHSPFLNLFKVIILNKEISHQVPYHLWYVVLAILTITPTIYLIYYFTERIAINYKKKSL